MNVVAVLVVGGQSEGFGSLSGRAGLERFGSELVGDVVGGVDEEEQTTDVVLPCEAFGDVAVLTVYYECLHGGGC